METLRQLISDNKEIALGMLIIYILGFIFKITKIIIKERKNKWNYIFNIVLLIFLLLKYKI